MQGEMGLMQPQAKTCQEPPKLEEARKDAPLEPFEGAQTC